MTIWRKWLDRNTLREELALPSVGYGARVYAIGDIHGRADLLDELLAMIAQDDDARSPKRLTLILLGDLLDRGPSSRQVIERIMALCRSGGNVQCLKGNHEEIFILAARGDSRAVPVLRRMDGRAALASYGLAEARFDESSDAEIATWMQEQIPRDHVDFLDALPDSIEIGDYLFVHAGIRPKVPIDAQDSADLRWIRREFLDHVGAHPRMIVHGHSVTRNADMRANRIGIDTGAYYSGRLTAIGLEGTDRWILQTGM